MDLLRITLFYCLLFSCFEAKTQNEPIVYKPAVDKNNQFVSQGHYLIITAPEFESTLEHFVQYKQNIGFEVMVVNTQTTGKTNVAIKNYIQNLYDDHATRPKFVLLVGDVEHIPAYQGNPSGKIKKDPITDLGYSLLEGNGLFADVFLGRFSVENSTQLKNIIDKTIFMEKNMSGFDKKALLIAGDEKKGVWNRTYMRNSIKRVNKIIVKQGLLHNEYEFQALNQPDKKEVMNAMNNNPVLLVYSGHGSIISLSGKTFEWENSDILTVKNTIFPFVFTFSCRTGNYAQTCIGEHFIRAHEKGGVAYFGSSVNTQTNSDPIVAKKIFGEFFSKDARYLSEIINLGKKKYYNSLGVSKKKREIYLKAFNLLGDPSFNVKGNSISE
ncbi:MAG: C25 family cysteine peptidase [Bacteroidales bacterium]|jgi:hypothetical protein|nr:C25 family cysteine peptidase [Bacteroidales bacterium]